MKGATAYEFQWGRVCFRFCHLMGGHWKWYTFWPRIKIWVAPKEDI